jgi:hypothetical protein
VICVSLVARFYLDEALSRNQFVGFALMGVAIGLILAKYIEYKIFLSYLPIDPN